MADPAGVGALLIYLAFAFIVGIKTGNGWLVILTASGICFGLTAFGYMHWTALAYCVAIQFVTVGSWKATVRD